MPSLPTAPPSATPPTAAPPRRRRKASRYILEEQVGFLLRQVSQRHTTIFGDHTVEDLTPTQFSALVKLHEVGSLSQNLLGRQTAMDAATIKGVIDRLGGRGYIEGRPDPDDARLRILTLTPLGRAVVERAIPAAMRITEETLSPLDADERATLLGLLKRLC